MPSPVSLDQLFGAFVNQGTLEEAAELMTKLATQYPEMEFEFYAALRQGASAASRDDQAVVSAVNSSGYQVANAQEAGEICSELLLLFLSQHNSSGRGCEQ